MAGAFVILLHWPQVLALFLGLACKPRAFNTEWKRMLLPFYIFVCWAADSGRNVALFARSSGAGFASIVRHSEPCIGPRCGTNGVVQWVRRFPSSRTVGRAGCSRHKGLSEPACWAVTQLAQAATHQNSGMSAATGNNQDRAGLRSLPWDSPIPQPRNFLGHPAVPSMTSVAREGRPQISDPESFGQTWQIRTMRRDLAHLHKSQRRCPCPVIRRSYFLVACSLLRRWARPIWRARLSCP